MGVDAIAVIPARAGSKRIPGKNIRLFAGKPMIAHSILAAKGAGCFSRVIVSTDSEEVAQVARAWGAEIPFLRPASLADDHATTAAVLQHALMVLRENGEDSPFACCMYATAPMMSLHHLREGYECIRSRAVSAAVSVTTYPHPIQRALCPDGEGVLRFVQPEYALARTQDLRQVYHDAAQFYWVRVGDFLRSGESLLCGAWPVQIPRKYVCDIDTEEDWQLAEALYRAVHDLDRSGQVG